MTEWWSAEFRSAYLTQWEDGLLAAGGFVAALSATLPTTLTSELVAASLLAAALGKALPGLLIDLLVRPAGPFPRSSKFSRLRPSPPDLNSPEDHPPYRVDLWAASGDGLLLLFGLAAFFWRSPWGQSPSVSWFLALVGIGFFLKALTDLIEQGLLSWAFDRSKPTTSSKQQTTSHASPSPPDPTATPGTIGAHTIEDILLGSFGLAAILLAFPAGALVAGGSSLGLAALGKALPSIISAASTADKPPTVPA